MGGSGKTVSSECQPRFPCVGVLGPAPQITLVRVTGLYLDLNLYLSFVSVDCSATLTAEERPGVSICVITAWH